MKKDYVIMSDNMGDLPQSYYEEHQIPIMYLSYTMEGETFDETHRQSNEAFYRCMREGALPTTSQITPNEAREHFLKQLRSGKDVLCLSFSSGLSGTYNSCALAAQQLREEGYHIEVIDTLCASLGQGLLLYKAVELKEKGADFDEVRDWVLQNRLNICHVVVADDLYHLMRGGRISRSTSVVGSMLSIKPLIQMNDEGKLIPTGKSHGRKKGLRALVNMMGEQMGSRREENDIFMICHADCEADAEQLAQMVQEAYGIENYLINYIGPVIGSHTGPDTLALFYLGDQRMSSR